MSEGLFLAGRGRRLVATVIDAILVPTLTIVLVMITGVVEDAEDLAEAIVLRFRRSGHALDRSATGEEAIEFLADKGVSYINAALCKGCGTCVAACPAQAITGAHFNNQQIGAEIEGLLYDAVRGIAVPA